MILMMFVLPLTMAPVTSALYFHIGETERKCFIEEIPEETRVTGEYKLQLFDPRTQAFADSSPEIGVHVEIRDPEERIILSKVYSSEGRFTFTSTSPGEHVICLYSNSTKWFSGAQIRVHLDIKIAEEGEDYSQVAKKEKLSELQLRVRQILDQVERISKEQNYQRFREEKFRGVSEATMERVLWWALGQTATLLLMGAWQMKHLKGFFQAKKLV